MKNYNRMYGTRDIAVLVLKNWRTASFPSFSAHNSGSIDLENCTTVNFEAYPLRFKMDMDRTSHYFFLQLSKSDITGVMSEKARKTRRSLIF